MKTARNLLCLAAIVVVVSSSKATASINIDSILSIIASDTLMQRDIFRGKDKPALMVCRMFRAGACRLYFVDQIVQMKQAEYPQLSRDSLRRMIVNRDLSRPMDSVIVLNVDVSRYQSGDWVVSICHYEEKIIIAEVHRFFEDFSAAENCISDEWLGFGSSAHFMFVLDDSGNVKDYYLELFAQ